MRLRSSCCVSVAPLAFDGLQNHAPLNLLAKETPEKLSSSDTCVYKNILYSPTILQRMNCSAAGTASSLFLQAVRISVQLPHSKAAVTSRLSTTEINNAFNHANIRLVLRYEGCTCAFCGFLSVNDGTQVSSQSFAFLLHLHPYLN